MPYYKRNEKCTNASGEPGSFVTIKKDGGKRQCWKNKAAFERAQAARHAKGVAERTMRITESRLREIIREEAEIRYLKQTISEVIDEMNLNLTQEQRQLLEEDIIDSLKKAARKARLPLLVMAALAFGSQVAADLQDYEGVGTTVAAAQKISNAIDASQNISQARADAIEKAIEASAREGEISADLQKGVSADTAKDIAMDRLETEFVQKGAVKSTGQAQAGPGGAQYLVFVPYDSLPDGYKDTFTRGAEKEDLKQYYQTMDIQDLKDLVTDFNSWGSEGSGQFYDSEVGKLLPASWSIAYKALQDKTAERGAKGKSLAKENA